MRRMRDADRASLNSQKVLPWRSCPIVGGRRVSLADGSNSPAEGGYQSTIGMNRDGCVLSMYASEVKFRPASKNIGNRE